MNIRTELNLLLTELLKIAGSLFLKIASRITLTYYCYNTMDNKNPNFLQLSNKLLGLEYVK